MVLSLRRARPAFSLIELVIVVVIIGIIGAIAIPRMSRGAEGAADSALTANLATIRSALDLFATEHGGRYPAFGDLPNALIQYSDEAGTGFSATKTATHIYGPYLRGVPTLPVGARKGDSNFVAAYSAAGGAWVYTASTGQVVANTDPAAAANDPINRDAKNRLYSAY